MEDGFGDLPRGDSVEEGHGPEGEVDGLAVGGVEPFHAPRCAFQIFNELHKQRVEPLGFGGIGRHAEPDGDGSRDGGEAAEFLALDEAQHADEGLGMGEIDGFENYLAEAFLALRGEEEAFDGLPGLGARAGEHGGRYVAAEAADWVLAPQDCCEGGVGFISVFTFGIEDGGEERADDRLGAPPEVRRPGDEKVQIVLVGEDGPHQSGEPVGADG